STPRCRSTSADTLRLADSHFHAHHAHVARLAQLELRRLLADFHQAGLRHHLRQAARGVAPAMHHERILPARVAVEHPHGALALRAGARAFGVAQELLAGALQVGTLDDHRCAGLEDARPLAQHADHFPAPEMLDHMDREHFVGACVLERLEAVQVADHVGLAAGARGRDIHIDIAGQDLVAAAEIELHAHARSPSMCTIRYGRYLRCPPAPFTYLARPSSRPAPSPAISK